MGWGCAESPARHESRYVEAAEDSKRMANEGKPVWEVFGLVRVQQWADGEFICSPGK